MSLPTLTPLKISCPQILHGISSSATAQVDEGGVGEREEEGVSSHASGDGVSVGEVGGVSTSVTSQVTVCGGGMDEEDQGVDGEGGSVSVLGLGGDVQIEQRGIDEKEEEKVTEFCSKGCGCSMKCSSWLSREHIRLMQTRAYRVFSGYSLPSAFRASSTNLDIRYAS